VEGLTNGLVARLSWESRRLTMALLRRVGWEGAGVVVAVAIAISALLVSQTLIAKGATMRRQLDQIDKAKEARPVVASAADGLAAFQAYLPAHDDIPETVKRLLILAEDQGVAVASGEYQVKMENGYVAYRMSLPIKGEAGAVQTFLILALRQHPTLALETATFRREKIESNDVEARLHLTLMTRLPDGVVQVKNK